MTVPQDRPVVYPDDDVESKQHDVSNSSSASEGATETAPLTEKKSLGHDVSNSSSASEGATETAPLTEKKSLGIPENLLIKLSSVQDYAGLLEFLGTNGSGIGDEGPELNGTVGKRGLSGGKGLSHTAGCQPELQTVELEKPKDTTHVYWPMCVRVLRCGGCCTSSLLTCMPVKKTKLEAKVLHAHYLGQDIGREFEVKGLKTLPLEKHDKCECRCREQPEDCTELQVYKEAECKCICKNKEDSEKCTGANRIWNPKECVCSCHETDDCSSGFFYNSKSCRCEAERTSLIGKRLLKSNIINATLAPDSAEPVSNGDSPSTGELPTTSETPTTATTTKGALPRGRKARLRPRQRTQPK